MENSMNYENAKDILPATLLAEVQKYAKGKIIYIPKADKPKGWGEASGCRQKLMKRNALICSRYSAGQSVYELAEEFFLSPETIKKLVYGKKTELPEYSPTIVSARHYTEAGLGEEWARIYLESLGETMPDDSLYFMMQLVRIPLRFIEEEAESGVNGRNADNISLAAGVSDAYEVPLIVFYEDRRFTAPYQREYLRTLMSEKRNSHYALVFARKEEYIYFWNNFGKNFLN